MDEFFAQMKDYWENNLPGPQVTTAPEGTREFFDQIAEHRYSVYKDLFDEVDFNSFKGKKLLEIGCGTGTDAVSFAKAGARVTAIDLTERAIRLTKKRFEVYGLKYDEIKIVNALHLDFPDNIFDAVYSHGVLLCLPNIQDAIKEIYRVLKPGGITKVMVYNKDSMFYHYWIIYQKCIRLKMDEKYDLNWIIAESTESTHPEGKHCPYIGVYTAKQCYELFRNFKNVKVQNFVPLYTTTLPEYKIKETDFSKYPDTYDFFIKCLKWEAEGTLTKNIGWFNLITAYR
ncbi:MAG: class I SAM-dependent methyltransferase [Candidatus Hydrogenedentota bacterium]